MKIHQIPKTPKSYGPEAAKARSDRERKSLKEKLRKRVHPTIYETAYIMDVDRYTFPVEGVLDVINKLKEKGFPESLMNIYTNVDVYDNNHFSGLYLKAERPKTELEIEEEIQKLEELEKFKRQEQNKNRVARERREKALYEKLHKKYGQQGL